MGSTLIDRVRRAPVAVVAALAVVVLAVLTFGPGVSSSLPSSFGYDASQRTALVVSCDGVEDARRLMLRCGTTDPGDPHASDVRSQLARASPLPAEHRSAPNTADVGLSTRGLRPAPGTRVRPEGVGEGVGEGWRIDGTRSAGGTRYYDPTNSGNSVRVMQGNPSSPNPTSLSPYVRWQQDGHALDAFENKLPTPKHPDAHIPLDDFRFLPELFR